MEDTESLSPNKRNETIHQTQKIKTSKNKKNSSEKLIVLPQTGLAVKKLPPIMPDKTVPLPSKTPTSPLVQVMIRVIGGGDPSRGEIQRFYYYKTVF